MNFIIQKNNFKVITSYLILSLMLLNSCSDQTRVVNTTKPQYVLSLAEISSGPYYSDSCLDCTDISEIKFQVSLSENGEPIGNKQIDFNTTAIEGLFPYNHVTFQSNTTSSNGTLLFTFDDKGQSGSVDLTVSVTDSDTTVSTSTLIEILPYYTLVDQLSTWITESSVVAGDTTSAITFYAQVKDTNNASLPNIPIQFANESDFGTGTLYSSDPSLNPDDPIYTNSLGKASLNYKVESTDFDDDNVILSAKIVNQSSESTKVDSQTVAILRDNSDKVDLLEVWVIAEEQIEDNINVTVIDTIFARALTNQGQAVSNVAIQFEKETSGFGYISESSVLTDEAGLAKTIYFPYIDESDTTVYEDDVAKIKFFISVGSQGLLDSLVIGLDLGGSQNIEFDVEQFSMYPNYDFTTHILGNESEFSVIVKDGNGVGVSNVPVRFAIEGENENTSNGVLSTSVVYTCCSESNTNDQSEAIEDGNIDGNTSGEENSNNSSQTDQIGIAKVNYYNINGGSDSLKAFILNPLDASIPLHYDALQIRTNTVTNLNAWSKNSQIYVNTLDSLFCDSLYVKAVDSNGNTLEDIQIYYALSSTHVGGYINVYEDNTTNLSRTSTASFCPDPGQYGNVSIEVSTNISGVSDTINIEYIDDLPECENCEAELKLIADQYILPYLDSNNELTPTSIITATLKDSLGYDPEVNTLVYFQAVQEDSEGNFVDVGSITDYGYFLDDGDPNTELVATTTFDMFDASGIVSIIGTSEGLSDTIYISIESTTPSSVEIIPPYPNEIMVSGGGGLESTNIDVAIKDGDGNPVTEPHWVRFTIIGAPEGTHLNGDTSYDVGQPFDVLSSNGISTVPVNAGIRPGSVQIKVELYSDLLGAPNTLNLLATSQGTPITIATGPPAQGVINYSYVDITTIGGGLYQIPVSIDLWDVHSNPVADSTNVYFSVRGVADPYDPEAEYYNGDRVFWAYESTEHGVELTDSLVYECKAPLNNTEAISFACQNTLLPTNSPDSTSVAPSVWEVVDHPANIVGVAKTANENFEGEAYPGKAWTDLYFSSSTIFDQTILFASTYSSDGTPLIVDSRANHDGGALDLPLTQDGTISIGANPTAHDFTTGDTPVQVGVSASINDYYQYPIDNGLLFLNAPFSEILNACNAVDSNGNGRTGWCCDDVNGDGLCEDTDGDLAKNYFNCTDCGENNWVWEFDDCGGDGDCDVIDADGTQGDGIQDDNPAIGLSNRDGTVNWTVQYDLGINICDCTDGQEVCEDRESNITASLLNPLQTGSDPVQVILSETDPTATTASGVAGSCP